MYPYTESLEKWKKALEEFLAKKKEELPFRFSKKNEVIIEEIKKEQSYQ